MPGSTTTPGRPGACDGAPDRVAFRAYARRRHPGKYAFAAQWLACAFPCRRFADTLAVPAHGSGPMWFATPSSQWTCTTYSLPVSRRTINIDDAQKRHSRATWPATSASRRSDG